MWYKVNKRLIGTKQVRPSGISKSIDLRWKTLAQIQAEWWDITSRNWWYNLNSNWLTTTSSTNNWIELYTPIALTAWNKVTVNLTGSWTRTDANYSSTLFGWVWTTYGNNTPVFVWAINTWSQWGTTWFEYNGSLIWTSWPHSSWGDFEMTLTFDLRTWAATYTLVWAMNHTTSMTLTSAQISWILNSTYFRFRIGIYKSDNTAILKTVSFKVE